jgi:hypothetical protein
VDDYIVFRLRIDYLPGARKSQEIPHRRRRTSPHPRSCNATHSTPSRQAKRTEGTFSNARSSRFLDLESRASGHSQSGGGRPSKTKVRASGNQRKKRSGSGQQEQQQEHVRASQQRHRQEFRQKFRQHRQTRAKRGQNSGQHRRWRRDPFWQQAWLQDFFWGDPRLWQAMACPRLCCEVFWLIRTELCACSLC